MKVIQVPYSFYPDPVGGSEISVSSLTTYLQKYGVQVIIAAPFNKNAAYIHNNIPVRRFAVSKHIGLEDLYGEGDIETSHEFAKILDMEKPDLVHLHGYTAAISLRLAHEIKKRRIRTIFTYHTPTASCQRGTLMKWGNKVCSDKLSSRACTSCVLHGLGSPKCVSNILSITPEQFGKILDICQLHGGIWTALRMKKLIRLRHAAFRAFTDCMERITVPANWCKKVLIDNDILEKKIMICRYGIYHCQTEDMHIEKSGLATNQIKVAFLGRMEYVKGPDIVIKALCALKNLPIEFHIYGIIQNESAYKYMEKIKNLAKTDSRIIFMPPIPNTQVTTLLKRYHLLVVPSRCLETGPLVVLEAFAAGIPVVGADLGGIAELVKDEISGLLVKHGCVKAWSKAIRRICEEKDLLNRLQHNILPPRTISEMAQEMKSIYDLVT